MQVSTNSTSCLFRPWHAVHILNLSNRCGHKYNQSISRFFQSNFWRVFAIRPNCAAATHAAIAAAPFKIETE